jgi:hypothetical protein
VPLRIRCSALEAMADDFPQHVRLSELLPEETDMGRLVEALAEHRLKGIVVKKKESMYREGKEPGSWVKFRAEPSESMPSRLKRCRNSSSRKQRHVSRGRVGNNGLAKAIYFACRKPPKYPVE